jgi:hypothetical protein
MSEELMKKEEPNVNVELTVQELNVVLGALQELPHRVVDSLIRKIIAQAQPQVSQQPQAPVPGVQ